MSGSDSGWRSNESGVYSNGSKVRTKVSPSISKKKFGQMHDSSGEVSSLPGSLRDWQSTKHKVSQRGKYLLEKGQWTDCKFLVGQEPHQEILEAHQLFLAMSSPVFEAMFYGSMAEKKDLVPIPDVQPKAFKLFLEYIYTDNIVLESFEVACELCYCAKKYMLPYLVEKCTKYISSDLSVSKVCRAYEFAKLFEESALLEKCFHVMCTRTATILESSSWRDVEIGTISTLFDQNYLAISGEIQLFNSLLNWSRAKAKKKSSSTTTTTTHESRRSLTNDLVKKIRFLCLTPKEFADGPAKSGLLTRDEAYAILMNISSNASNIPMPEGFSTEAGTRNDSKKYSSYINRQNRAGSPIANFANFGNFGQYERTASTPQIISPYPCSDDNYEDRDDSSSDAARIERIARPNFGDFRFVSPRNLDDSRRIENPKLYCRRCVRNVYDCINSSAIDFSVTFQVNKNICVHGVEVPTQRSTAPPLAGPTLYTEILYAYLLDSHGSRLTYTHFTTPANCDDNVEIDFNRPVFIQKNKTYQVGVRFNKTGKYPIGVCSSIETCHGIQFTFDVGRSTDIVCDGLIKSIIFKHH